MALADGGIQRRDVGVPHRSGDLCETVARHQLLQRQVVAAHGLRDRIAALLDSLIATLAGEPLADLAASPRARDEGLPVLAGPGIRILRRVDLDHVAGGELRVKRHEPAVHLRPHRAVTHLGVHGVGEVDRRRARGQSDDLALRRVHVELFRTDLETERVEELAWVLGLALPVVDVSEPGHVLTLDIGARGTLLVLPVRGDAVFGTAVHLFGADLDLDMAAAGADHGRVQRLVEVVLRRRDVVLHASRHRPPARMDLTEHRVAVAHRLDDDAHTHEIIDLAELVAALPHLLVDRVVLLRTPRNAAADAGHAEVFGELLDNLLHELVALRRARFHEVLQLDVHLRLEDGERKVLELGLHGLDAQSVCERRIDLEGLASLALRALARDEAPCARIVQPIGQLDDQHADVLRHRDDHLAHRLGLGGLTVLQLVELRDAVDEHGDLVAEVGAALIEGVVGVLDRVVQECGCDRHRSDAELGQDLRDCDRMRDVRFARLAELALVRTVGDEVGALDQTDVGLGVLRLDGARQRVDGARPVRAREQERQQRTEAACCVRVAHGPPVRPPPRAPACASPQSRSYRPCASRRTSARR